MSSDQIRNTDFKKTLLTRLLDGVKGCQSRFGSRSELATEDDDSVARLCAAYEDVFSHGFKSSFQSSTSKTAFWVPAALRPYHVSSFWPLIKSQLSKHEAERFLLLHNVRSDVGRCRAWIRASLNEHSLERYILIILSLEKLNDFYEPWAFIRDQELNSILPQTAAGLGSVLFALTVDNANLDDLKHVMEKNVPEATSILSSQESIEVADQAILALSPAAQTRNVPSATVIKSSTSAAVSAPADRTEEKVRSRHSKKKKKKPPVNFVSFDDDENERIGSFDSVAYSSLPVTAVSTPTEKKLLAFRKEDSENANTLTTSNQNHHPQNYSDTHVHISSPESKENIMAEEVGRIFESNNNENSNTQDALAISENESSEPSVETPVVMPSSSKVSTGYVKSCSADPSICSTSVKSVDCISVNSAYSDCSERLDLENISLAGLEISPSQRLKPIVNDLGGSSSGLKNVGAHPDSSHDLIPVPSYDSTQAPDLHLDVEPHGSARSCNSSKIQSPATPTTPCKSISLSLVAKDTLHDATDVTNSQYSGKQEEVIKKLKTILDREIETVATLRADLAEQKRNSSNQIKILEAKIDSLSKENEILKHQLKKYVGAVQLLKREGSRRLSLKDDEELLNSSAIHEAGDSSQDAAEYERKLIQVAEMHGELMEFNAHLQKAIQKKDAAIKRLKDELIDLRGPLANPIPGGEEDDDDDSWDIVESSSSSETARSRSATATARRLANAHHGNERVLINIWIPSAFLTGATNDLHHVYQVFVRIKDMEWNIYRRYSQFYSLHRDLSKNNPVISSLYFPPKKHLGNKDAKFVDERRRKLQDYLRAVVNHTLQTNSILASHPEKNLLISILPFFGESFNSQTQRPKRERSRTRNLFFRQSGQPHQSSGQGQTLQFSNYPQYTGL